MTLGPGRRRSFRTGRTQRSIWTILLLLLIAGYQLYTRTSAPAPDSPPVPFSFEGDGPYKVERVVDGDTILLEGRTRVRMIGIDTPESVAPDRPVEPLGKEASEFTRSLIEGREVTLQYDRERRDQHDRVLAYVLLGDRLINEEIIRAGFSRAEKRFPFDSGMKSRFLKAEKEARAARRGLWRSESPGPPAR
ncbi:MAG: thermonuclease family protein [Planctomycetaceae bacterium]